MSQTSEASKEQSDYAVSTKYRPKKRARRIKIKEELDTSTAVMEFSLEPLYSIIFSDEDEDSGFERLIEPLLEDYQNARDSQEKLMAETDKTGNLIRPLRVGETGALLEELAKKDDLSLSESIILRKLKLDRQRKRVHFKGTNLSVAETLTPLPPIPNTLSVNPEVLDALYAIQSTPYSNSFLARLNGTIEPLTSNLLAIDWETSTPWMNLMTDIRDHYTFSHPERGCPDVEKAPIIYTALQVSQLPQVHDLLQKSFWDGIDISDSLDYQPEKSTVIAMYKKIVVGVAIITSPLQTHIMYLAVKSGWNKSQIAKNMLYHLITLNPGKDFTLHVSTNSSAMLLYNQFGFKAEEFVYGFYSEYLPEDSRASKNAFRLRLRHLQDRKA